ncbi:MAG: hypothetical protein M3198_08980 [Actinomycetota bacterium]|nr:hypothetical protein [Actinomycetota bacterium]
MTGAAEQDQQQEQEQTNNTVSNPAPDRIDTNERGDDVATVVQPDGEEIVDPQPSRQGRV